MDGLVEGRIIHYVLRKQDADSIVLSRQIGIMGNMGLPNDVKRNRGNWCNEGDHVPMMIVKVWPDEFGKDNPGVNGQCFLDGNDQMWITSSKYDESGKEPGTWHWIEKA